MNAPLTDRLIDTSRNLDTIVVSHSFLAGRGARPTQVLREKCRSFEARIQKLSKQADVNNDIHVLDTRMLVLLNRLKTRPITINASSILKELESLAIFIEDLDGRIYEASVAGN